MKNKKSTIIYFILTLLITSIAIANTGLAIDNERVLGRTRIRAIGTFHICEDDEVVYGHIFIGFEGFRLLLSLV